MENKNKISIITPTYNNEKTIAETLNSILGQTYKNLEIIIIDDCSKDHTVPIIKDFNDCRIRLLRNEKNMGAAYSRNRAIASATGDYIAFLDADDLWKETKIEKQLTFMLENNYDFTYTNYEAFKENKDNVLYFATGPRVVNHRDFLRYDYVGCLTVMYKKNIYSNLQIPNSILKRNDYALWLKLSEKASCYLLNESLAYYRTSTNRTSLSSGGKFSLLKYHYKLFRILFSFNMIKSWMFALRNGFYYFIRNKKYRK